MKDNAVTKFLTSILQIVLDLCCVKFERLFLVDRISPSGLNNMSNSVKARNTDCNPLSSTSGRPETEIHSTQIAQVAFLPIKVHPQNMVTVRTQLWSRTLLHCSEWSLINRHVCNKSSFLVSMIGLVSDENTICRQKH